MLLARGPTARAIALAAISYSISPKRELAGNALRNEEHRLTRATRYLQLQIALASLSPLDRGKG